MIGLELYIKDINNTFYCYKQRHSGYIIIDFLKIRDQNIFNLTAEDIIFELHSKYFMDDTDNYHSKDPLEYGLRIPNDLDEYQNFDDIYLYVKNYIYNKCTEDKICYDADYSDYVIYIDLIDQIIEGNDKDEESDSSGNKLKKDEDCGCP